MAVSQFDNIEIKGIACAVPDNKVENKEFIGVFTEDEVNKFIRNIGVREFYANLPGQTCSDLCFTAVEALLEKLKWERNSIDALIFISQTPDYPFPPTACVLQHRLKLSKNCMAFDVSLGCAAYTYGMNLAASLLQNPRMNRILLLTGDQWEKHIVPDSFLMLFGAAGSATAIERGKGDFQCLLKVDGAGYDKLISPTGAYRCPGQKQTLMDGPAIFEFSIFEIPETFQDFFREFQTRMEEYDYCILHQANKMILKNIAKKLKLTMDKVPISMDRYGNTNGSTIPVTIVDLCSNLEDTKVLNLIASGFGVGLTWGVMSFKINSAIVLPMIYSSDYFKEAYKGEVR